MALTRFMRPLSILTAAGMVFGLTVAPASIAVAEAPCTGNAIVCENLLPGTPDSVWDDQWGSGDDSIQGFATQISVNVGGSVQFKIKTDARAYTIKIYRLGYYQGNGARQITQISPSVTLPQTQPACATDATTEIYDCGTWAVSASWAVPSTAVSGVYFARLVRTDTGGASQIPFIVRNDCQPLGCDLPDVGSDLAGLQHLRRLELLHRAGNGRAYKVSYNRPFVTRDVGYGRDFLFSNEYPMIRFMEQNGYDVSYISGLDTRHPRQPADQSQGVSVGRP